MTRHAATRTTVLLVAVLGLAGCSGDPSEADMLAAVNGNAQFQQAMAVLAMDMRGRVSQATLNDLKSRGLIEKSACAQAQGAPGYVCDFRWGASQPDGKTLYGAPMKGRFFKSGDGWVAELTR